MKKEEIIHFDDIVKNISARYQNRHLELKHEGDKRFLYCDGERKFCTTGYNMLYNMKRLCDVLADELM